jgi:hypothetical protein
MILHYVAEVDCEPAEVKIIAPSGQARVVAGPRGQPLGVQNHRTTLDKPKWCRSELGQLLILLIPVTKIEP